ncbi:hypothetical protein ACWFRM_03670 [Streptomyces sp. NPDC055144]
MRGDDRLDADAHRLLGLAPCSRSSSRSTGTVTMCMAYPPEEFGRTLERIADGRIDAAALVTGQVGLGGVSAALDTLRQPDDHVKVLVRPGLPGPGLHPAP